MVALSVKQKNEGNSLERFHIPEEYLPPTGYGEVIIRIKDGKIVNCETKTSHKLDKELSIKRE